MRFALIWNAETYSNCTLFNSYMVALWLCIEYRADFRFAHSQLEMALLGDDISYICNIYFAPLYPIETVFA